jgi:nucleoside-diphosphate-sugar epimerase
MAGNQVTTLVTGGAGFLGSHVAHLLAEAGERPRVLALPDEPLTALDGCDCEVVRGDLTDRASLGPALAGVVRVVNCAARTGPWGPKAEYERANVVGLETLVEAALAADVRRIVHISSITVHGNNVRGAVDETAPFRVEPNPYSRSKLAGEYLLQRMLAEERAPVTVVRPGWIYGPGDRASFGWVTDRIAHGRMGIVGRGDNRLPLIFVRDAARGVLLAADADGVEGNAYLLVNDEPVTQREFLGAIASELHVPEPTRHVPYAAAFVAGAAAETAWKLAHRPEPPPVMRYGTQLLGGQNLFVVARARRELGFVPVVDMAEGVRQGVEWYLAERAPMRSAVAA